MNEQYQQILAATERGDLQQIDTLLTSFLLEAMPEQQYELVEHFMYYGYLKEADRVLEHLLFLLPDEPQLLIDRATILMELGMEDEALDLLLAVEKDAEEYPQALIALADYYQMQGLFEVAEQRINEALTILPDEPLLHFAKAELLFETGRFLEASRLYEELYAQTAEFAGISLVERLAEVYRAGAAYETALGYYKKALEDEVKPDMLFGAAYSAFQSKEYTFAIKTLAELKELDPDYFSAYLLLAESYAMLEENDKAYETITEGLQRDEYDKSLYLFAGKMALKLGKPQESEAHLRQAIALDPEYMEALLTAMSLLKEQQRDEDVIELFTMLESTQADWTALYPIAAASYAALEDYDRAYTLYKEALPYFKEDVTFLEEFVYFLLEEGRREEAAEIVKQILVLQPAELEWQQMLEQLQGE